ncbi:2-amino-4-hydroxy-6-hydroxymethyldihydropteridine pyrophosphokinase [Chitinimonas prasina]|uniref:2-amino-4-hydroxy-6-hydroxymethyldihydropteridine pyrophosphokinase n=1 Tax=Chitinimonas prasina TaxID=1434937 RepID=A0ABQ5YMK1_9NEIS|nr:2-amino-4-hydroxy-6-hydroxymethyldihydropteridine diphosphokinase [Chitinimonas prasina]GLR15169.1 2-amino-4-hydroxy-6-hydroxymethyldihydropteridine pyrophosphokinase [Chitinimonas prasina]
MSTLAYIGLGANLGDAAATLDEAVQRLGSLPGTRLLLRSSLYRSAPVGYLDQPDFTNAVAAIETELAPHAVLDGLLAIEQHFGRQRSFRNAPRTLDMDLLLYGDTMCHDDRLTLPHPRMASRGFVMLPLLEIAPTIQIPGLGDGAGLLAKLDTSDLERLA